jgi:phage terminase small subunit
VDGRPRPLPAPKDLSPGAKRVWAAIVSSVQPEHFRLSDGPLLRSYCEVTATADLAAKKLATQGAVVSGKTSAWLNVQERAIRAQAALALRLRLCPSARTDPKSIGRQPPARNAKPWDFK